MIPREINGWAASESELEESEVEVSRERRVEWVGSRVVIELEELL